MEDSLRISYSKLTTYLNCPRGYQFQYLLNPPKAPSDSYYAYIGSVVQYIFEQVTNHKIHTKTDLKTFIETTKRNLPSAILSTTYDMYQTESSIEPSKFWKELQIMQIDYEAHTSYEIYDQICQHLFSNLELYWKDNILGSLDDIICEQKTTFTDVTSSGVPYNMVGYIDFLIKDKNGTLTIVDGKKNYKPANHKPEQIGMYLWALRDKSINTEGQFWSYKTSKLHKVQIDLKKVKGWMDNTVDLITDATISGEFPTATSSKACFFCAYKHLCNDRPR